MKKLSQKIKMMNFFEAQCRPELQPIKIIQFLNHLIFFEPLDRPIFRTCQSRYKHNAIIGLLCN